MAELGRLLRETRENRGLTLSDVERATRIRVAYLQAFEEERFGELPGEVSARGFLRNYARFLGLDEKDMLAQYGAGSDSPSPAVQRLDLERPFIVPLRMIAPARRSRMWFAFLGALLGVGFWFFWQAPVMPEALSRALASPTATMAALITQEPTAEATETPEQGPTIEATETPLMNQGPTMEATETPGQGPTAEATETAEQKPTVKATATARVTRPAATATRPAPTATRMATATPEAGLLPDGVALDLQVTAPSWLEVTVDGELVYQATAPTGSRFSWEGHDSMSIRAGNAGGVLVTVNGELQGRMGDQGEVLTREWVKPPAVG